MAGERLLSQLNLTIKAKPFKNESNYLDEIRITGWTSASRSGAAHPQRQRRVDQNPCRNRVESRYRVPKTETPLPVCNSHSNLSGSPQAIPNKNTGNGVRRRSCSHWQKCDPISNRGPGLWVYRSKHGNLCRIHVPA